MRRRAGLWDPTSKALGVALLHHAEDGWPDFVLANDTQPNKLYRNDRDGSFTDVGMTAGIAFGETGVARAGMGVDSADYSGVGRASLLIANFANEMIGLFTTTRATASTWTRPRPPRWAGRAC